MIIDILLLIAGGALLYYGAEWLVGGAAGLARKLGVTPLVIGLTVVSYGTSAPELAVSVTAAVKGQSDIALGNVIGSNIANTGLILGLTALIAPPTVHGLLARRELRILLAATFAVPAVLWDGTISRMEGILLTAGAAAFTWASFLWSKQDPGSVVVELPDTVVGAGDGTTASSPQHTSTPRLAGLLVVGLVVLMAGGRFFVMGAVGIAHALGMSERMVGLTIVAFGTSLPELAASVLAALKGHSDIAVGNVIGSNVFNIFLILGITSLVHPIAGEISNGIMDLATMLGLTLFMAWSMRKERVITRLEGGLYASVYVAFILALALLES